jgi:hypothetical protein
MPSPDFSEYIDLTEFDLQPATLYNNSVAYARTALPELEVRPGTIEDAMIQAGAFVGAAAIGALNRLPDELMEGLLRVTGINRNEATAATVEVEFTLFSEGDTIEENTVYVFDYFDGSQTIQFAFSLDQPITAQTGQNTVTATLSSLVFGPIPSFDIGTQLVPNAPSTVVFSCETIGDVVQGLAGETDEEFLNRAATYLQSLSATLNTAKQIENYIVQTYSKVNRCKVYDLSKALEHRADTSAASNAGQVGYTASVSTSSAFYASASAYPGTIYRMITPEFYGNAGYFFKSGTFTTVDDNLSIVQADGLITFDSDTDNTASAAHTDVVLMDPLLLSYMESNDIPGSFVVFVCDVDGAPVGRDVRTQIENEISERITAGLQFKVLDAWTYDLSFTITIGVLPGFSATAVADAVKDAVEDYVSPNSWPNFSDIVRLFEIVSVASNVNGVDFVSDIDSDIPEWPDTSWGNEKIIQQDIAGGSQVIAYRALYAGMLPRATVEVVTL